jgi:Flp pilus assembly protein TadG
MVSTLRRFFECANATAAVEAAIFLPIFLTLTLGVTDIGSGMFVRMQINAAAQAGAAYVIKNGCASGCLSSVKTAMNDAAGNPSLCTSTSTPRATCTAQIQTCTGGVCSTVNSCPNPLAANTQCIITVRVSNYPYSPILPDAVYYWASSANLTATGTIRVQ